MTLIEFKKLSDKEQKNWLEENISNRTDLNYVWNKIHWISKQKFGQEETKNKETTKKRTLNIPISEVKDLKCINKDETIEYINFYTINHNSIEYIINMYRTTNNRFYTNITDITNGYKEISIDELKRKSNVQLTIDFFNI